MKVKLTALCIVVLLCLASFTEGQRNRKKNNKKNNRNNNRRGNSEPSGPPAPPPLPALPPPPSPDVQILKAQLAQLQTLILSQQAALATAAPVHFARPQPVTEAPVPEPTKPKTKKPKTPKPTTPAPPTTLPPVQTPSVPETVGDVPGLSAASDPAAAPAGNPEPAAEPAGLCCRQTQKKKKRSGVPLSTYCAHSVKGTHATMFQVLVFQAL